MAALPGGRKRHPWAPARRRLLVLLQQYGNLQERGHNLTFKTGIWQVVSRYKDSLESQWRIFCDPGIRGLGRELPTISTLGQPNLQSLYWTSFKCRCRSMTNILLIVQYPLYRVREGPLCWRPFNILSVQICLTKWTTIIYSRGGGGGRWCHRIAGKPG